MVDTVYCVHCGAVAKHPVSKMIDGQLLNFCCGGCLQVYEMLHEEGLSPSQSDTQPQVHFQPGPLHPVDVQHGGSASSQTIKLPILGMTCTNCVARVGNSLRAVHGVLNVSVDLAAECATIEIVPGEVTVGDLRQAVKNAGYEAPLGDTK